MTDKNMGIQLNTKDIEAHRIAVISDTHGLLRAEVIEQIRTCERILHAGDIGKPELIDQLKEIAETYLVRGNVDREKITDIPNEIELDLYGFRIYMVHNKKDIRKELSGVDLVIYGHSHKYEVKKDGKITYLNPGSCGSRRFRLPVTMMLLTLYPTEHKFEVERIDCLHIEELQKKEKIKIPEKDMYKLIKKIIKDADSGKKITEIAARNQVDEALVEQICRIYVTHPGVDIDGIMNRMEIKNL